MCGAVNDDMEIFFDVLVVENFRTNYCQHVIDEQDRFAGGKRVQNRQKDIQKDTFCQQPGNKTDEKVHHERRVPPDWCGSDKELFDEKSQNLSLCSTQKL